MRSPAIHISMIHIGFDTLLSNRIGNTDGRDSVGHRNAVGTGVRAKIGIKRPVFLENDNNMFDFMDTAISSIGRLLIRKDRPDYPKNNYKGNHDPYNLMLG